MQADLDFFFFFYLSAESDFHKAFFVFKCSGKALDVYGGEEQFEIANAGSEKSSMGKKPGK